MRSSLIMIIFYAIINFKKHLFICAIFFFHFFYPINVADKSVKISFS